MKKFYCPYCGERTLSSLQKFAQKRTADTGSTVSNQIWFSCSHCDRQVEHKSTRRSQSFYNIIIPLYLALGVLFVVLVGFKQYLFALLSFAVVTALAFVVSAVSYRLDVFVRVAGDYDDRFVDAEVVFKKPKYAADEAIYRLCPGRQYLTRTNVGREYIVAVTDCDAERHIGRLRVIKPHNASLDAGSDLSCTTVTYRSEQATWCDRYSRGKETYEK